MTILDDTDRQQDLDEEVTDRSRPSAADAATTRRWPPTRIATWVIGVVIGAVAVMYAGIFFYATVLNDAPDELDSSDLSAALVEERSDVGTAEPSVDAVVAPTEDPAAANAAPSLDGVWTPSTASEFGYRVDEVLSGVNVTAVGRSNQITGELTVDGTTAEIDVTVQVADIRSDNGSRDGQFRGRIMNADEFPTASFATTTPIDFGELPESGEQITVSATGDLTLRGVTRSVTFDVTAQIAAADGAERIGVLGSIPVVFDDFGIPEPSIGSVSVEDNGLIEFVLVFER